MIQPKKVYEIIRPADDGIPMEPSVGIADPISKALELMLKANQTQIAVAGPCGPIGCVRLQDALRELGIVHAVSGCSWKNKSRRPDKTD